MNPSPNLFLIGPTGAGKTTLGRYLAAQYGMPFTDLDDAIVKAAGMPVTTIFAGRGEAAFRRLETAALRKLTCRHGHVIATGAGAILAPENRRLLAANGFVLWLDAGIDMQLARLANDTSRPLMAAPDRHHRLALMATRRTPLYRQTADLRVAASNAPVAEEAHRVMRRLGNAWKIPTDTAS